MDLCEGEGRSRRNSAGLGRLLRCAHSEKRGLEALTRSLDSTHSSLPGLLWHFFLWGEGTQVLLRREFSQGTEIIPKTLGNCWGLSKPWRTQGIGLAIPNAGSPI